MSGDIAFGDTTIDIGLDLTFTRSTPHEGGQ
jgi:hypothetical protein